MQIVRKTYIFQSPHDCGDCEWIAFETDGDIRICDECEAEDLQECEITEIDEND